MTETENNLSITNYIDEFEMTVNGNTYIKRKIKVYFKKLLDNYDVTMIKIGTSVNQLPIIDVWISIAKNFDKFCDDFRVEIDAGIIQVTQLGAGFVS